MPTATFISTKSLEPVIARFFGRAEYPDWTRHLILNEDWGGGTVHTHTVEPPEKWIQPNHQNEKAEALDRGCIHWNWELAAILNEAGWDGVLPLGEYVIMEGDVPTVTAAYTDIEYKDFIRLAAVVTGHVQDTWVGDMEDRAFGNDTAHHFVVEWQDEVAKAHQEHLGRIRAKGGMTTREDVQAVLNELGARGLAPLGRVVLGICW